MQRHLFSSRMATSMLVVALLFTSVSTVAAVFTGPELQANTSSLVEKAPNLPELLQKAQVDGTLPVIVMLAAPFQAESQLNSAAAVDAQRAALLQTQDALLARLPGYEPASVKKYHFIPAMALTVDAAGLAALAADPQVTHIEEDGLNRVLLGESVPLIGAPTAWAAGYSGSGQVVAILDTGVDKNHAFLAGKVVAEACYSSNKTNPSSTSICPGGASSSTAVNSAMPYLSGVCPAGECDHGTHVAGITAGKDPGGLGFNGVAKDGNLIAIQVFARFNSYPPCGGANCAVSWNSDLGLALEHVYDLRTTYSIASVNMSLGGGHYTSQAACDGANSALKASIDKLRNVGIAVVIASGNGNANSVGYTDSISSPACISSAISVGSTQDVTGSNTTEDAISPFSNSASFLSLLAPGQWITSSVPGGGYETWDGTSMATPHVAGAWAVMKSKFPAASVSQILDILKTSGKLITDGRNGVVTPRIRLDQAILGYSISGKVTLGSGGGAALAGVTVSVDAGHSATSDASGNYTINGLLAGNYTVTPSLGANVFSPASAPVTVGPSQSNINFFAPTYSISGKVRVGSSGGAGLAGVTIRADVSHSAVTAADGTYTLSNLLAGTYTVTPSLGANVFSPTSTPVTVSPSRTGIDFIAQTYTISGKVTIGTTGGAGKPSVTITADASHLGTSDADGNYTITNLLPGTYTLTPSPIPAGHAFKPVNTQVTVGPNASEINFIDITGYTVAGNVTVGSSSGPALAGVTVGIDASHSDTTDSSGNYIIFGVAAGSYTLTPSKAEYTFVPVSSAVMVATSNIAGKNFVATQITYSVAGKVTEGSSGLAGVTVSDGAGHTGSTNASGNYTLSGLVKGSYTLSLTKPKYTFTPSILPVNVSSNMTGINFTGFLLPYDLFIPLIKK